MMARSTGPMLAVGAVALGNETIVAGKPFNWRIPIATGIATVGLAVIEKGSEELAVGLAWLTLVTILLVRTSPSVPAPIEAFNTWWKR